jgi:hypothetical protein
MSTTATASDKKSRRGTPHACVFDNGQVAELNATARRIQLFGELVVNMLEEEEEWKEKGELLSELVWTTTKDAVAILALVSMTLWG